MFCLEVTDSVIYLFYGCITPRLHLTLQLSVRSRTCLGLGRSNEKTEEGQNVLLPSCDGVGWTNRPWNVKVQVSTAVWKASRKSSFARPVRTQRYP